MEEKHRIFNSNSNQINLFLECQIKNNECRTLHVLKISVTFFFEEGGGRKTITKTEAQIHFCTMKDIF
jgi:hypothetical protein